MMRLSLSSRISSSSPSSPALKNTWGQGVEPRGPQPQRRVAKVEGECGRPWLSFPGPHHLHTLDLGVKCEKQDRKEAGSQLLVDTGSQESGSAFRTQLFHSVWLGILHLHPKGLQTHLGVAELVLVVVNVQGAQQLLCPFPAINELTLGDGRWVQDAIPGRRCLELPTFCTDLLCPQNQGIFPTQGTSLDWWVSCAPPALQEDAILKLLLSFIKIASHYMYPSVTCFC